MMKRAELRHELTTFPRYFWSVRAKRRSFAILQRHTAPLVQDQLWTYRGLPI